MATFWKALILAAMAAVALVLALGIVNMAGGKSMNRSQRLMRWRIALQLIGNLRDHGGGIFCIPLTGCINILTPPHELSGYVPLGLTKAVPTRQSTLAYLRGEWRADLQ